MYFQVDTLLLRSLWSGSHVPNWILWQYLATCIQDTTRLFY